jgi:hypothetical protein
MSKTRTPKRKTGKEVPPERATVVSRARKGGIEADKEVVALLTQIWELWYPGVTNPEELNLKEQKVWVRFREAVIRGQYSIAELTQTLNKALGKQVDAELDYLKIRRKADLADQKQLRKEREQRLAQEISERKTNQTNGSRERYLLMVLITICVVFTVMFACLTAKYAQAWGYAGTGTCLALTGVMGVLCRFRALVVAAGRDT